ncbi:unnamed protein product [Arabis nemorensis]|uniref:Transcription initiation factor IIA gamma subunit C-terminal domain-containing protein n=1 Tax=Arabis nemorensis TaxID=586526 RepID=A0A565CN76_9BRAS|nr:unnamed protein product [Arabis nemorensis]
MVQGHLHTYRFCDNVWTFILHDAMFKNDDRQENVRRVKIVACDSKLLTHIVSMATSKAAHCFQLVQGTELQITVTRSPNGSSVRAEFHLKNCMGSSLGLYLPRK